MGKLRSVELFMALGLSATLVACGPSAPGDSGTDSSPAPAASPAADGGEGGEGGEEGSSIDADVNDMVSLGLMKGHMRVAKELIDLGQYDEAEPHIGHPVEELYGDIEAGLAERKVKDFKATLNQLHDLIKSKPQDPQVAVLYAESLQKIEGAIAALPAEKRESPQFVLSSINDMLTVAADEYGAAIADNKFVELVEYQDSRGFVVYASELYQTVSSSVAGQQPEVDQALQKTMKDLAAAWPAVNPPPAPVIEPAKVTELIAKIKTDSEQVK
ncbi:MAG: hypothetical protein ACFCU8_02330 [Thermosynechococcaceae cyanobacterium]